MKSIGDFVAGKIRRLEVEDEISFVAGGEDHPDLGPCEGTLVGPAGEVTLYERGMTAGQESFSYEAVIRVEISPVEAGRRLVDVRLQDRTVRFRASDTGGEVLHAALRWIGNTRLRRKIAD